MTNVSVIVTTYNRPDLVKKTILSILNQTFIDFELIVVDNYSDYNFFGLIEEINDDRIRAFQNKNNGIISINRNFAIEIAKNDFIAFCDDDDIWEKNKLQVQVNFIYENNLQKEKFVIYSNCLEVHPTLKKITEKKNIKDINDFILGNQIVFSSSMISNILLKERFNEDLDFIAVEDYLFWMNLKLKNYEFFLITNSLLTIKIDNASMSLKNYGMNHIRSVKALINIYRKKNSKINSLTLTFSIIKEISKFMIKRIIFLFIK
jgi:teichuronic acid biosynthesis glycosyltransferase TuaG